MTTTETVNTGTDPVPNSDLPSPESFLNQDNISLYGHLLLAALSDDENVKKALNPEEKLDTGTINIMQGARLKTAEAERKYNPAINGLSVHERTEKWKDKSFEEAYAEWSSKLLSSINQSESQERKDFINNFFGKNFSEIEENDIQELYDKYCREGSNIDDFVKKAVGNGSSSTETEWLAKKLFGTKSGELVKRAFEIESEFKRLGNVDSAIRNANELFWTTGLDRFNNPNDEEKELLGFLYTNFKKKQDQETSELNEGAPPQPTENLNKNETESQATTETDKENTEEPSSTTKESTETPATIATPTDNPESNEKSNEENNGAPPPPPLGEAENETPEESHEAPVESENIESTGSTPPATQPSIEADVQANQPEPESTKIPPSVVPEAVTGPNPEPTASPSWPPAEVEPVNNTATSLVQKIRGIFKK